MNSTKMTHFKLQNNYYLTIMISYSVIEGSHKNPNEIKSLDEKTKKVHGPFSKKEDAESLAKSLIQKNVDDFYHRAWVIEK
tara:strand:+ start:181 stop:423 length:243 start_codon:yes stop_codon:yes gene_type:complete